MRKIFTLASLLFFLAACATPLTAIPESQTDPFEPAEPAAPTVPYPVENPTVGTISSYPAPGVTEVPYPYPAPVITDTVPTCAPEPADSRRIDFAAADGTALAGTYYPPRACGAPLVILYHQAGMDKESWVDLALWLQNRADETGAPSGYDWFPAMPADLSFAVFAIDFRGHGESAETTGFDPAGFVLDAQAALATGKTLAGADPARVITIGASIGADASVDACVSLDGSNVAADQTNQGCIGAMPLSPGNFLGVSYTEAAARLGDDPHDAYVYCIAAENDANAPDLCRADLGSHHRPTIYTGGDHGINLLEPGLSPDIGQLILDFLLESLGLE